MSIENDERFLTILRVVSQANLGGEPQIGLFAKLDDICEEMGDAHSTKQIIKYLEDAKYIRCINDKYEIINGRPLDYKAYQITEHGKTKLQTTGFGTNISVGNNANVALNSPNSHQLIQISTNDPVIQEKIIELQDAIKNKDTGAIKKIFGYIADKSIDLAITILSKGMTQ